MAASLQRVGIGICRTFPVAFQRSLQKQAGHNRWISSQLTRVQPVIFRSSSSSSSSAAASTTTDNEITETTSRYSEKPWDYLKSEEYIERYGEKPIWSDYRRNHKGGIPPQKTRKTCIRGHKISGNPCPICRDANIIVHYKNLNLLQQFISPHTGMVYDPTRTGVCMKQQKLLNAAIGTARDHGLLATQLPHVDYSKEDYSNTHDAVGQTPPPPLEVGELWYPWYGSLEPDEQELARVKRIYKDYLKKDL